MANIKKLLLYVVQYPKRVQISSTLQQKPELFKSYIYGHFKKS